MHVMVHWFQLVRLIVASYNNQRDAMHKDSYYF